MPDEKYSLGLDINEIIANLRKVQKENDKTAKAAEKAYQQSQRSAEKAYQATERAAEKAFKAQIAGHKKVVALTKQLDKDLAGKRPSLAGQIGVATGISVGAIDIARDAARFTTEYAASAIEAAAATERLGTATDNLGRRFGVTGDAIVAAIQEASLFTINKMDAMRAANQAMLLGVAKDEEEFRELTEIAVALGRAMGQDATKSIEDMTIGIGRQSKLILDNLGIMVNTEKAYDDFATSVGKTANELTEAEKKQAFLNAVLEQGRQKVEQLGGVQLDTAGKTERLAARMADLQAAVGGALLAISDGSGILDTLDVALDKVTSGLEAFADAAKASKELRENAYEGREGLKSLEDAADTTLAVINPLGFAIEQLSTILGNQVFNAEAMAKAQEDLADTTGEVTDETEENTKATEENADAQERLADALADAAKKRREAGIDFAQAQDDIDTDFARQAADLETEFGQRRAEAAEENQEAIFDIELDFERRRTDLLVKQAQKREDLARENAQRIADINREYAQEVTDATRDFEREQADLAESQADARAQLAQDEADRQVDIETEFRRRLQDIQGRFLLDAEEAERNRDAVSFLRSLRQRDQEISQAQTDRNRQVEDNRTEAQRRRAELQQQQAQERQDLQENYQRRLEDLAIQHERELEAQRIQFARQQQELTIAQEAEREQLEIDRQRKLDDQAMQYQREIEDIAQNEEQKRQELLLAQQRAEEDARLSYERRLEELRRFLADSLALIEEQADAVATYNPRYADAPVPAGTSHGPPRRNSRATGRGRQHGGPVSANQPYTVGEAGPEVFTPKTAGSVSPAAGQPYTRRWFSNMESLLQPYTPPAGPETMNMSGSGGGPRTIYNTNNARQVSVNVPADRLTPGQRAEARQLALEIIEGMS